MNVAVDQPLPIPLVTHNPLRVGVVSDDPVVRNVLVGALETGALSVDVIAAFDRDDAMVADPETIEAMEAWIWDLGPSFDADTHLTPPPHVQPFVALAPDATAASAIMRYGAHGALGRESDGLAMASALQSASLGLTTVDSDFIQVFLTETRPTGDASPSLSADPLDQEAAESLTTREMEVLELLAEGRSNREVAMALEISEHTAKFHIGGILNKLDAATRTEAVVRGFRLGILAL